MTIKVTQMTWDYSDFDQVDQRPKRGATGLILFAVLCVFALGVGVGWLLFSCDRNQQECEATPLLPAATAAVAVLPTSSLLTPAPIATPTIPTATPTAVPVAPVATSMPTASLGFLPPGFDNLQAQTLDLINQSRADEGLSPVAWDDAAAQVAQAHAEDMLTGPFFSHWNRAGYGPEHRAALDAGMTDAVFENIHAFWRTSNGQPAPIQDWPQRILDAHEGLMDSPGHRRNIMDPAHTHVGIGIAYRPEIGELRLVQLFLNRYVELDPLPRELPVGAEVEINGRLINGASDPLVNLAYEPFPQPLTLEQLAETSSYQSAAQFISAPRTTVDGDRFRTRAILDFNGQSGLYHVWVFVMVQGEHAQAASAMVVVR